MIAFYNRYYESLTDAPINLLWHIALGGREIPPGFFFAFLARYGGKKLVHVERFLLPESSELTWEPGIHPVFYSNPVERYFFPTK